MKRSICLAALGLLATLNFAAAKDKDPFKKEHLIEVVATIEAVDPASRLLSVRGPAGAATIVAGPEVKNFDQIKVGDHVKVVYHAALAAAITKSKKQPTETYDSAVYSAPKGERPAGGVGQTITTTVKIESVDTSFDVVTFKRPDGFVRSLAVSSPEGKKFIRTLKKGDLVDVEYTEALAILVMYGGG